MFRDVCVIFAKILGSLRILIPGLLFLIDSAEYVIVAYASALDFPARLAKGHLICLCCISRCTALRKMDVYARGYLSEC